VKIIPFIKNPLLALFALLTAAAAQDYAYEKAPFNYWSRELDNPVTRLQARLDSGKVVLPLGDEKATLAMLLKELEVSPESQVVVFSKTSLQRDRISRQHPRAIFFNEQTYVGTVPGGLFELTTMEKELGPIFYALDPNRPDRKVPRFDRNENCMSCHGGGTTDYLPGFVVRSVFPDEVGEPLYQAGTSLIDQNSPLTNRWGGWFVTGNTGNLTHRGNATATMLEGNAVLHSDGVYNQTTLDKFFETKRYLRPTSDVISLLILEHQAGMHNRITKATYDVRGAIERRMDLLTELGEKPGPGLTGSALSVAKSHVEKVLQFLLFAGEAALPEGGVEGSRATVDAFHERRIATKDGRSLRDLQLLNRVFKYRCSYLIYAPEWDGLPAPFLEMIYQRLYEILTSKEPIKGYEHLVTSERRNILEILRETKPGLPDYFMKDPKA
jgi:hypothetical protein